ncbi:MAG: hypothetical protein PHY48_15535 [Candidatus Cloacimonetes bacterium]|nr:hypothetical protein [Candidatus Cloacimonadota bacterium]
MIKTPDKKTIFTTVLMLLFIAVIVLVPVFLQKRYKSNRMCAIKFTGLLVLDNEVNVKKMNSNDVLIISEALKIKVAKYLVTGKHQRLDSMPSSIYLLGWLRFAEKPVLFGVLVDDDGHLLGFDISEDNASITNRSKSNVVVNSNRELAEAILKEVNSVVGLKKLSTTEDDK